MHIEAYLVLKWHGQHRFSFTFNPEDSQNIKFVNSLPVYDYLWDVGMRSHPTLREWTAYRPYLDVDPRVRDDLRHRIVTAFYELVAKKKIMTTRNKTLRVELADGYVEFANVPHGTN